MKSEYQDILNALSNMSKSPYYASRKTILLVAERAIVELEQRLLSEPKKPECEWAQDDKTESDAWNTKCGNAFLLSEGTPAENDMKYCPYCGGRLVVSNGAQGTERVTD